MTENSSRVGVCFFFFFFLDPATKRLKEMPHLCRMILYNWILPWGLWSISTWFWSGLVSVNLDKVEDIDTYSMKPLSMTMTWLVLLFTLNLASITLAFWLIAEPKGSMSRADKFISPLMGCIRGSSEFGGTVNSVSRINKSPLKGNIRIGFCV